MHIGVDLDNTIINLSEDGLDWNFKEGAIHYLKLLSDEGHYLHVITARSGNISNRDQVETIMKSLEFFGVRIADVTYTMALQKGRFAKDLQCAYLIDDSSYYLEDCIQHSVRPILFLNQKEPSWLCKRLTNLGWKIVFSWNEIYTSLSEIS